MKRVYGLLFILHEFVGIGALAGGMMAILSPHSPGGVSIDLLNNSPFSNYLIPGIFLFAVIGLGNIFSGLSIHFKLKYHGYISSIFSWTLVFWIIIQCIMIRMVASLHVIYLIIGLVEAFLSTIILYKQRLFPTNIILNIISYLDRKFPGNIIIKNIRSIEKGLNLLIKQ